MNQAAVVGKDLTMGVEMSFPDALGKSLLTVDVAKEDFVKVMPGGRYFVHANGTPFIPIGGNHNPDWPELEEANPFHKPYDPGRTDKWFEKLHDNGVNIIRLMIETPPSGSLEDPVGTYHDSHIRWLDNVISAARKHDVKLWITPYDTFWMSRKKEKCKYWAANGGPVQKPIDFLTKPEIIDLQKKRMKFLIDRYGNTGTVFAWEIMNEIDIWWDATPEQIRDWTNTMSAYVRTYQRQKWGRDHLVTISFADPEPKGINADTSFRRPDFDFSTMHLYLGASRATKPGQAEQAGEDFAGGVRYARQQITDNRPVMDGESGPIDGWIKDGSFDDEVFYQMSWQHMLAGGAGAGTRWPYRVPHVLSDGMLAELKAIRTFADDVPWKKLTGTEVKLAISHDAADKVSVFATDKAAIVWARAGKGGTLNPFTVEVAGAVTYREFSPRTGQWVGTKQKAKAASGLKLVPPATATDVAVWISKE